MTFIRIYFLPNYSLWPPKRCSFQLCRILNNIRVATTTTTTTPTTYYGGGGRGEEPSK